MPNSLEETDRRLRQLERRLDRYHEHLEASLEHDRKFQLEATWGIVKGTLTGAAFLGCAWLVGRFLPDNWLLQLIVGAVAFVPALVVIGYGVEYLERKQKDDEGKLSRLPEWDPVVMDSSDGDSELSNGGRDWSDTD